MTVITRATWTSVKTSIVTLFLGTLRLSSLRLTQTKQLSKSVVSSEFLLFFSLSRLAVIHIKCDVVTYVTIVLASAYVYAQVSVYIL